MGQFHKSTFKSTSNQHHINYSSSVASWCQKCVSPVDAFVILVFIRETSWYSTGCISTCTWGRSQQYITVSIASQSLCVHYTRHPSHLIYFNESPHLKIQVGARATTFLQQIRATWSCWMWWCFLLYLTAQKVPTGYCVSVCSHLNIDHCKNWLQFIDINNKQSTIFSL